MRENKPEFEVIEDQPLEPKRKLKRKYRPLFGQLPWGWFAAAFAGAAASFALFLMVTPSFPPPLPVIVTATPSPVAINLDAATPVWMNEPVLAFIRTTRMIAIATKWNVRLYQDTFLSRLLINSAETLIALAFSPDTAQLAALTAYPGEKDGQAFATLKIWDTATGDLLHEVKAHQGGLNSAYWNVALAYSPDGKWIATGAGDGYLILWDATTLEKRTSISTLAVGTTVLAFSSASTRLTAIFEHGYTSSPSRWDASVEVWDLNNLAAPNERYALNIDPYFASTAVMNGDANYVAYIDRDETADTFTLRIHDLFEQAEVGAIPLDAGVKPGPLAISADGDNLALVEDQMRPPLEPNQPVIEQKSIRTIWWWRGKNGFGYQSIAGRQPLTRRGADHLHLWLDGNMGLDYIALDNNSLIRWNFATHSVLAIGL